MSTAMLPLQDLARTITEQEAELARLRQEFETRQAKLQELLSLKQMLNAQLENVEEEIALFGYVSPAEVPSVKSVKSVKATPVSNAVSTGDKKLSMPKLLIEIVRKSSSPLASKELTEAVVRSGYPTKSDNLQAIVETRVADLVRKGIFVRAKDQPGVVMAGASRSSAKSPVEVPHKNGKATPVANGPKKTSLRAILTRLLTKSARPMNTEELMKKVLATGYQTKSQDFKNVLWVSLGAMKNVERVNGEGYRLKDV